ncbi:hypothetical protein [Acidithiobacillus sp.]|uniref:hypothetical protein n=1 Tax=Acidithiobacillus sp. TaxID=1872118 RepID=UPI0026037BE1|nr:hypothetical protein [Acidithiobacillus sp.]MDD2749616.1 hypothetical protein [Acidithiobacillus sp.]MDD5280517.1 hypothetical protein [Acidithiobacillus sp.]
MADMKIAMTLTMADLASPEIQKFKENLAQLGDYLKKVSDTFKVTAAGASEFGKATVDASVGVRQFSRAIGGASRSGYRLGDVLKGLQDQIAGFRMEMASASATTSGMGAASIRAGAGLEAMGAKAAAAKGEMNGLHGTMKGLMELYAAFKIGEAGKKAVELGAEYQTQKLQLQQRNLPAGQYRALLAQANQQVAMHPWLTKNEALETQAAALSELPGNTPYMQQMRAYIAPQLQYLARRAGMYGDKSSFFHRIQNSAGLMDAMGAQQNPYRAGWVAKDAGQVIAASYGKDTLQSMETSFRALSKIMSVNMNQGGFRFFNAGNEEFKAAGGGGSGGNTKMPTLLNALATAAAGGVMGKGAAYVLEATGLIKKSDVHKYGHSSTRALVSMGSLLNTNTLLSNPGQFVFKTLVPHFESLVMKRWKERKPGMVNPDTAAGLSQDTAMMGLYFSKFGVGGQSLASIIGMLSNPEIERSIIAKMRQMQQVDSNKKASQGINATAAGQWKIFNNQLHNLGTNIGTTLLPMMTSLLRVANQLIIGFNSFVQAFPKVTMFAAVGAAVLGLVEAFKGLSALLGLGKSFSEMFGLMSKSALKSDALIAAGSKATATEVAASNLAMESDFALTAKGMVATSVEMVATVGKVFMEGFIAFAAGWEIWQSIKNFEIAGHTLNAYAGVATMAIAQQFDAMFTHIANGFINMDGWLRGLGASIDKKMGLNSEAALNLKKEAADNAEAASNIKAFTFRSHIRNIVAMQDFNGKPGSGEPAAPTGESPADALYKSNVAGLPGVPGGSLNPSGGQSPTDVRNVGHHADTAAQNKLSEAFRKRIEDALRFQAHLQHIAQSIHTAYQGIFDPLSSKIPAIQAKYRALSGYLLTNGHTKAAQEALAVGHHQVLGLQYKGAMGHLNNLQRTLHLGTTDNAALLKTGVITNAQATDRNIKLQQQMAPQMQKAAEAALKYAEALKDPALIAALKEQLANIGTMGKQLGYYGTKFKQSLQSSFNGLFTNLMSGQKTLGESFAAFFASIGKSLENQLSKSLSQSITDAITGKHGSSGLGSLFSGITGMFSNVFGSGSSSSSSSNPFAGAAILGSSAFSSSGGSSWLSGAGGLLKGITSIAGLFGFASGADNIPNDMVANIHKGEMIIPAAGASLIRSGQAGIGGGGGGPTLHMHINTIDSQDFLGHLHEIRAQATQMFLDTAQHLNVQGVG